MNEVKFALEIVEIYEMGLKKKWMKKFLSSYNGQKRPLNGKMFGKNVRFFMACDGNRQLGFIRINDKTDFFSSCTDEEVWNAADAYVKSAYRGNGVLTALLRYVIENCSVKMTQIETHRLVSNMNLYRQLGFTYSHRVKDGSLSWAFLDDFKDVVIKQNEQRV
jgi:hypothetical protein